VPLRLAPEDFATFCRGKYGDVCERASDHKEMLHKSVHAG
jgi:hypothetical protein